jgi:hypothetical protein
MLTIGIYYSIIIYLLLSMTMIIVIMLVVIMIVGFTRVIQQLMSDGPMKSQPCSLGFQVFQDLNGV